MTLVPYLSLYVFSLSQPNSMLSHLLDIKYMSTHPMHTSTVSLFTLISVHWFSYSPYRSYTKFLLYHCSKHLIIYTILFERTIPSFHSLVLHKSDYCACRYMLCFNDTFCLILCKLLTHLWSIYTCMIDYLCTHIHYIPTFHLIRLPSPADVYYIS